MNQPGEVKWMAKYTALLRGVNRGGRNILSMQALGAEMEQKGFLHVQTYSNSGNILFERNLDADTVRQVITKLIHEKFGIDTPVAVFPADALVASLSRAPVWWNQSKEAKHNAIFLIPPLTAEEAIASIGEAKPEYEQVDSAGSVIFWSAPIKTFSRTRWSKVVGSSIYNSITIRNANTAMKLLSFLKENVEK